MDVITLIIAVVAAAGLLGYTILLGIRLRPARRELEQQIEASLRPAEDSDIERFRALLEPECEGTVPIELVLEWINIRRVFDEWSSAASALPPPQSGALTRCAHAMASRSRTLRAREELGAQLLRLSDRAGYETMLTELCLSRAKARELILEARRR